MFCPGCGERLEAGVTRCTGCGRDLEGRIERLQPAPENISIRELLTPAFVVFIVLVCLAIIIVVSIFFENELEPLRSSAFLFPWGAVSAILIGRMHCSLTVTRKAFVWVAWLLPVLLWWLLWNLFDAELWAFFYRSWDVYVYRYLMFENLKMGLVALVPVVVVLGLALSKSHLRFLWARALAFAVALATCNTLAWLAFEIPWVWMFGDHSSSSFAPSFSADFLLGIAIIFLPFAVVITFISILLTVLFFGPLNGPGQPEISEE